MNLTFNLVQCLRDILHAAIAGHRDRKGRLVMVSLLQSGLEMRCPYLKWLNHYDLVYNNGEQDVSARIVRVRRLFKLVV
jgi:hypothetical protein